MNPARVIDENAPAFIPVPTHLQHHRVEAIFWPLDEPSLAAVQPSPNTPTHVEAAAVPPVVSPLSPLSQLVGKAKGCFDEAASVDAFIRAGRDEWAR